MNFRHRRFADLVRRQLDLFQDDEAELLREVDAGERAYDDAAREDAEEAYGDYQLVLEAAAERLGEIRDAFAATLDADSADAYAQAFDRSARKRFPTAASHL